MCETGKSRTNSRLGARATGRMELAFTAMAEISVEQGWGWDNYSRLDFGSVWREGPVAHPVGGHGQEAGELRMCREQRWELSAGGWYLQLWSRKRPPGGKGR